MADLAQNLPDDVLRLIFEQKVFTGKPPRPGVSRSEMVMEDSQILGKEWVKQPAKMDSGTYYEPVVRWQPNHALYRLLLVCKSWLPVVRRELYRSIALGFRTGYEYDSDGFILLLRVLQSSPVAASAVQHLAFLGAALPNDRDLIDSHLTNVTEILRLCPNIKTFRFELDKGSPAIREALKSALSQAPLLESVAVEVNLDSRDVDDFEYWLFPSKDRSTSPWANLRTIILVNEDTRQDRKQRRFIIDMKKGDTTLAQLPRLQKLCMYHFQPSYPLLRSLQATPSPMRVFRCWLGLSVTQDPEYLGLLRGCLTLWAPSLQHLTLTWKHDGNSNHHRIRLGLIDETIDEQFGALLELQTSAGIMSPSCIAKLPNLRLLAYDTMDKRELEALHRAILEHKSLRCFTFHTRLPVFRSGRIRNMDHPDEFEEHEGAHERIFGLKAMCNSRGILFENSYERLDDFQEVGLQFDDDEMLGLPVDDDEVFGPPADDFEMLDLGIHDIPGGLEDPLFDDPFIGDPVVGGPFFEDPPFN
ncbi:hypothetical protein BC629DRAFT_136045 [Irpex lacteus]|nr:hypothetical protein BC629DRAFT_136045 [Irpex lacteus]